MNDSHFQGRREARPEDGGGRRGGTPPLDLTACCAEAQADGVPCPDLGRACAECERALRDAAAFAVEDGTLKLGI